MEMMEEGPYGKKDLRKHLRKAEVHLREVVKNLLQTRSGVGIALVERLIKPKVTTPGLALGSPSSLGTSRQG